MPVLFVCLPDAGRPQVSRAVFAGAAGDDIKSRVDELIDELEAAPAGR